VIYRAISLACLLASVLFLSGCPAAIVAGGAVGAASVAVDKRTTGTVVEDQAIEMRLANALHNDPELSTEAHIQVTAYNGTVLLTGEAPNEILRSRAVNQARNDEKVKRVFNEITLEPPLELKHRNYDIWLTTKVKTRLLGTKGVNAVQIKVITSKSTVYLLGIIDRKTAQMAANAAANVEGVRKVVKAFEYTD
jgi:osmotically-inducible protein OsmY